MKNKFLLPAFIAALFAITVAGHAQVLFDRTYTTTAYEDVQTGSHLQTLDGGVVFLTRDYVPATNSHYACVFKTDAAGILQWEQRIVLPPFLSAFSDIVESPDSSYFFVGVEMSVGGTYTMIRISPSGAVVFHKEISMTSSFNNCYKPVCIARNDGTFLIGGTLIDIATIEWVWHLMSIDHNGNVSWSKEFNRSPLGVANCDLDTCSNGDIVMLGQWGNINTDSAGPCICRISATGTLLWSKAWLMNGQSLRPYAVQVMPGDFISITGTMDNPLAGIVETFIIRLTGQGNPVWASSYGGINLSFWDMVPDGNNLLLSASSMPPVLGVLFEIDAAGVITWAKSYPGILPMSIAHSTQYGYTTAVYGPSASGVRLFTVDTLGNSCNDSTAGAIITTPLFIYSVITGSSSTLAVTAASVAYATHVNPIITATLCQQIGTDEYAADNFKVYPNPAHDAVHLHSEEIILSVELLDVNGRILDLVNVNSTDYTQILPPLPGLYLVRIQTENSFYSVRIVVE